MDGWGWVKERTKADRRGDRTRQPNNSWASEVSAPRLLRFLFTYKGVGFPAYYSLLFFERLGYIVNSMFTRFGLNQNQGHFEVILRSS
jgi:hypothetical protein